MATLEEARKCIGWPIEWIVGSTYNRGVVRKVDDKFIWVEWGDTGYAKPQYPEPLTWPKV